MSFSDFNPCQQNVTLGFVGQALKQAKAGEAVRGAWAEEIRNRPSLGCQRAIAHLFATFVRLKELNSFEFMNFFSPS